MLIAQMFSGEDVGDIGHSLRFRSSASAYLNRTFGSPTSNSVFTLSLWVKRGGLTGTFRLFGASTSTYLTFNSSDQLNLTLNGASACTSTAVFRDPTAHYHVVYQQNGSAQTLYVNGVSVATGTTAAAIFNTAIAHQLGAANTSNYLDGYLSRVCFVDGTALTPSSFGYFNTEINEWVSKSQSQVKAVVDAGGTNSFMLDFDDGTSLTTLGYDKSSKGNNWTCNNISLTAGVTYDWMLDVPGNSYCTLNPLIPSAANLTNGNLSSGTTAARGTFNCTAIDSQWFVTAGASAVTAGVIDDGGVTNTTSVTANKVFAFKMTTAGALSYKNVTDAGSWTSIATGLTGNRWPYSVTQAASWNFGQQPLPEALDTGFLALNQANLSAPVISNPETNFDIVLDTGANIKTATEAVFPSNFLEWIKDRANANNHQLLDTVRGSTTVLQSNTTAAETTYSAPSGSSVGWAWKAGGTPVSNTAGSITSSVSANQEAGFSIVSYTGTGSSASVGHGLGKKPALIIVKRRAASVSWAIQHGSFGATKVLAFDTTAAATDATSWANVEPTTDVFSVGTTGAVNASAQTYITYCFAEIPGFSKFGSYVGNASADGPYVHCGFKPKFVMIKRIDSAASWQVLDSARDTYNVETHRLIPNLSGAEATGYNVLDATSNGLKIRDTDTTWNASGGTYIFIAFADVPGKYSNAR